MSYLFAAYTVVWILIFGYTWMIGSKQKDLERKLDDLRDELRDRTNRPRN